MLDAINPSLDPLRFPQRKSVRLKNHDYAGGIYFVTTCVQGRRPLLGSLQNGQVLLSLFGRIVEDEWLRTNEMRPDVFADAFVVMPDHFHGLVGLGSQLYMATGSSVRSRAHAVRPYYLGRFIAGFKSSCTRRFREHTGAASALWQRGYYERVVRGTGEINRIRRYIANNPVSASLPSTPASTPRRVDRTKAAATGARTTDGR